MGMIWVGYRRDVDTARRQMTTEEGVEELLDSDDDVTSCDLDKAWHGIHWLLTGSIDVTSDVVSQAVMGGEEIGEDLGMGPGRLLTPDVVRAVSTALDETPPEVLRSRLDPAAMNRAEVYPTGIWDEADIFEAYVGPEYQRLRDFYRAAAGNDEAVVQTLT